MPLKVGIVATFRGLLSDVSVLSTLTQLTKLDLSVNALSDVSGLSSHTQLTDLSLAVNNLSDVSGLSTLTQLTKLDLSINNLRNVSVLSTLTQLTSLNLAFNNLSDVSVLSSLTQLTDLYLDENPLTNPPPEIAKKGIAAIRSYFRQMTEQDKARLYEARILLVGEPGAGKTTLWKKILSPLYPVPNTEEEPTLGIEINSQWEFPYSRDKGITFKTHIWDFGGQPIQYMLHQYFLTSRSLYVLVSDDREQRTRFDYWFDIIKVLGEKNPVLVVLNEKKHRPISNFDYNKYKKRYGPIYDIERRDVDFSRDDGRLDALRGKITEMLSGLTHIGDELPRQWVTIRQELESIKEENQVSINRYFDICRRRGLTLKQDMLTLCGYLNDLGVVLHYKDERSLEDTIFVNPHWIVDALYTAISDKTLDIGKGRFKKEWLFNLWEKKGYSYDERCKLLNLMLKDNFEICYRIDSGPGKDEEYMVPMLLPDVEPDHEPIPGSGTLKFRCQYPFMPEGIIARLTARLHEDIEKHAGRDVIWKKGFILNRQGNRARVAEDRSEMGVHIIDIKISGAEGTRGDFLAVIRNEIRHIHQKSFKEIEMEEMVSCNCTRCRRAETPHYFEYSDLLRYLRANKYDIVCSRSIETVAIWELIEAVVPRKKARQDFQGHRPGWREIFLVVPHLPVKEPGKRDYVRQLKDLEDKITETREKLASKENQKAEYDRQAERKARHSNWWIVGFNLLLVVGWAVAIGVFKWNVMEQWTFLLGGTGLWAVIDALYFAVFQKKLNSDTITANRREKERQRLYNLHEVNLKTIARLRSELREAEAEKKKLLSG